MPKFRKKPVEIEAVQWKGNNQREIMALGLEPLGEIGTPCLIVETLEGNMRASPGDWIIKGVKGEFYPCKPEIFAATYDAVEA